MLISVSLPIPPVAVPRPRFTVTACDAEAWK